MRISKGRYCAAVNCSNNRGKTPKLSFFRFPKDVERCKIWVLNSGRQDLLNKGAEYINSNCMLCANHFEENQCMNSKKDKLIWNALPTVFDIPKRLPFSRKRFGRQINLRKKALNQRNRRNVANKSAECNSNQTSNKPGPPVKRCVYVYCRWNSTNEDKPFMDGIFFLPVPSAESNLKKRKFWLEACGRYDLSRDRSMDKKNFYICSTHFVGGDGPTRSHPDPIVHRVAQKNANNCKVRVLNAHHIPEPPIRNETGTIPCSSAELVTSGFPFPMQNNTFVSPVKELASQSLSQSEDDPIEYEITVIPMATVVPEVHYSLSEIRSNYSVPNNWTMCVTSDCLYFAKISDDSNSVLVKFIINEDMSTSLQVLGRNLDSAHLLRKQFAKKIVDRIALDNSFLVLHFWNVCVGNDDKAFVSLFLQSETKMSGFYSTQTCSVHSEKCILLTTARGGRCKMCQAYRVTLKMYLRRFLKSYGYGDFWQTDENETVVTENDNSSYNKLDNCSTLQMKL